MNTPLILFTILFSIPLIVLAMIFGGKLLHKRKLRAVERSYYQGYSWAMGSLHAGVNLKAYHPPFEPQPATTILGAFDAGVADAMRAFDAIDGDKMWDKAKQRIPHV